MASPTINPLEAILQRVFGPGVQQAKEMTQVTPVPPTPSLPLPPVEPQYAPGYNRSAWQEEESKKAKEAQNAGDLLGWAQHGIQLPGVLGQLLDTERELTSKRALGENAYAGAKFGTQGYMPGPLEPLLKVAGLAQSDISPYAEEVKQAYETAPYGGAQRAWDAYARHMNPIQRFVAEMATDPVNYVGAGEFTGAAKLLGRGAEALGKSRAAQDVATAVAREAGQSAIPSVLKSLGLGGLEATTRAAQGAMLPGKVLETGLKKYGKQAFGAGIGAQGVGLGLSRLDPEFLQEHHVDPGLMMALGSALSVPVGKYGGKLPMFALSNTAKAIMEGNAVKNAMGGLQRRGLDIPGFFRLASDTQNPAVTLPKDIPPSVPTGAAGLSIMHRSQIPEGQMPGVKATITWVGKGETARPYLSVPAEGPGLKPTFMPVDPSIEGLLKLTRGNTQANKNATQAIIGQLIDSQGKRGTWTEFPNLHTEAVAKTDYRPLIEDTTKPDIHAQRVVDIYKSAGLRAPDDIYQMAKDNKQLANKLAYDDRKAAQAKEIADVKAAKISAGANYPGMLGEARVVNVKGGGSVLATLHPNDEAAYLAIYGPAGKRKMYGTHFMEANPGVTFEQMQAHATNLRKTVGMMAQGLKADAEGNLPKITLPQFRIEPVGKVAQVGPVPVVPPKTIRTKIAENVVKSPEDMTNNVLGTIASDNSKNISRISMVHPELADKFLELKSQVDEEFKPVVQKAIDNAVFVMEKSPPEVQPAIIQAYWNTIQAHTELNSKYFAELNGLLDKGVTYADTQPLHSRYVAAWKSLWGDLNPKEIALRSQEHGNVTSGPISPAGIQEAGVPGQAPGIAPAQAIGQEVRAQEAPGQIPIQEEAGKGLGQGPEGQPTEPGVGPAIPPEIQGIRPEAPGPVAPGNVGQEVRQEVGGPANAINPTQGNQGNQEQLLGPVDQQALQGPEVGAQAPAPEPNQPEVQLNPVVGQTKRDLEAKQYQEELDRINKDRGYLMSSDLGTQTNPATGLPMSRRELESKQYQDELDRINATRGYKYSSTLDPNFIRTPGQPGDVAEYGGQAYGLGERQGNVEITPASLIPTDPKHSIYDYDNSAGGKDVNYKTLRELQSKPYIQDLVYTLDNLHDYIYLFAKKLVDATGTPFRASKFEGLEMNPEIWGLNSATRTNLITVNPWGQVLHHVSAWDASHELMDTMVHEVAHNSFTHGPEEEGFQKIYKMIWDAIPQDTTDKVTEKIASVLQPWFSNIKSDARTIMQDVEDWGGNPSNARSKTIPIEARGRDVEGSVNGVQPVNPPEGGAGVYGSTTGDGTPGGPVAARRAEGPGAELPREVGAPGDTGTAPRVPVPTFFSALQRAIEGVKQERFQASQLQGQLKNIPGVKADEIKWSGLDDHLVSIQQEAWSKEHIAAFRGDNPSMPPNELDAELAKHNGQVTKAEVLDYLDKNNVKVEDVTLGASMAHPVEVENYRNQLLAFEQAMKAKYPQGGNEGYLSRMSQDEFAQHLHLENAYDKVMGGGSTKYKNYIQPFQPGEDYRELLLTISSGRSKEITLSRKAQVDRFHNAQVEFGPRSVEANAEKAKLSAMPGVPASYNAPHWDVPNIVVHVRFDTRVDANGKKTLFIHEIQSDWGQTGSKEGFTPSNRDELIKTKQDEYTDVNSRLNVARLAYQDLIRTSPKIRPTRERMAEIDQEMAQGTTDARFSELLAERNLFHKKPADIPPSEMTIGEAQHFKALEDTNKKVLGLEAEELKVDRELQVLHHTNTPDMPFKDSKSLDLAMKRMIRYAAENGYDAVGWTKGKNHVDRYGTEVIQWTRTKPSDFTIVKTPAMGTIAAVFTVREPVRHGPLMGLWGEDVKPSHEFGNFNTREEAQASIDGLAKSSWKLGVNEQQGGRVQLPDGTEVDIGEEALRLGAIKPHQTVIVSNLDDVGRAVIHVGHPGAQEVLEKRTMADKLWKRMQASPDSGSYMPRKEGMEGYYDNMAVLSANKLAKKFDKGNVVGESQISTGEKDAPPDYFDAGAGWRPAEGAPHMEPIHSLDVTPSMKESTVYQGQPQFRKAPVSAAPEQVLKGSPEPGSAEDTLGKVSSEFTNPTPVSTPEEMKSNLHQIFPDMADADLDVLIKHGDIIQKTHKTLVDDRTKLLAELQRLSDAGYIDKARVPSMTMEESIKKLEGLRQDPSTQIDWKSWKGLGKKYQDAGDILLDDPTGLTGELVAGPIKDSMAQQYPEWFKPFTKHQWFSRPAIGMLLGYLLNPDDPEQGMMYLGIAGATTHPMMRAGFKNLALATGRYPVANALDALGIRNLSHGVVPTRAEIMGNHFMGDFSEVERRHGFIPVEVGRSYVSGIAEGQAITKLEMKKGVGANVPLKYRVGAGAALGAIAPNDPDNRARAAVAGGLIGASAPRWTGLMKQVAVETEKVARTSAWDKAISEYKSGEYQGYRARLLKSIPNRTQKTKIAAILDGESGQFTPEWIRTTLEAKGVDKAIVEKASKDWANVQATGSDIGVKFAGHIQFDYNYTNADEFLKELVPFHFYSTRNFPWYAEHMAQNPVIANAVIKLNNMTNQQQEDMGLTGRFLGMFVLNNPLTRIATSFMGGRQGAGGFDLLSAIISVMQQTRQPADWAGENPVSQAIDYGANIGLSPYPGYQAALQATGLTGAKPGPSFVPLANYIRNVPVGAGIDVEKPLRALGAEVQSEATGATIDPESMITSQIRTRLAEMATEAGKPGGYDSLMDSPDSPEYKQAAKDVQRTTEGTSALSFIAPVRAKFLPDTEIAVRATRKANYPVADVNADANASPDPNYLAAYGKAAEKYPIGTTYSRTYQSPEKRDLSLKGTEFENLASPEDMATYRVISKVYGDYSTKYPSLQSADIMAKIQREAPKQEMATYQRLSALRTDWLSKPENADYAGYWRRNSEEAGKGHPLYNMDAYLKESGHAATTFDLPTVPNPVQEATSQANQKLGSMKYSLNQDLAEYMDYSSKNWLLMQTSAGPKWRTRFLATHPLLAQYLGWRSGNNYPQTEANNQGHVDAFLNQYLQPGDPGQMTSSAPLPLPARKLTGELIQPTK